MAQTNQSTSISTITAERLIQSLWFLLPLLIFIPMGLSNFISHSEFWAITSSQLLGSTSPESLPVYYRPVFYLFLKTLYIFPIDNISHIKAARFLFALIASLNVFLLAKIIYQWTRNKFQVFYFLAFLFSFHIFFYNFFRIRSDLFSLCFIFLAIYICNKTFIKTNRVYSWKILICLSLAFLSTPKSLFLIISFSIYSFYLLSTVKNSTQKKWLSALYFLIPILIISLISVALQLIDHPESNPFIYALIYYFNNLNQLLISSSWQNIFFSFQINFLHYLVLIIGYLFWFKDCKRGSFKSAPIVLSITTTLFFLLYAEKWDYFFACYIPFMSLPALSVFKKIPAPKYVAILFIPIIIIPLYMTHFTGWTFSNQTQLQTINDLDKLMNKIPDSMYFDSTGILPRNHTKLCFFGPGDESSFSLSQRCVESVRPTFVFYTQKVGLAGSSMLAFLNSEYIEIAEDIWILKEKRHELPAFDRTHQKISLDHLFIYDRRPFVRYFSPSY